MTRIAGHEHNWRIIAHTTEAKGKDVRVLLGCACASIETIRAHRSRRQDPAFFLRLTQYDHLCCEGPLRLEDTELPRSA